jgi:aminoglycoside phosphotransferase
VGRDRGRDAIYPGVAAGAVSELALDAAQRAWPEVTEWLPTGMAESVHRVRLVDGDYAYVRPDDGSVALLQRLANTAIPAPRVLGVRDGWLLLSSLPGEPLSRRVWRARPDNAAAIAAAALRVLDTAGIRHGDMCLPNILGDPSTGLLSGIVDWRYAGLSDREIDVASTVWSCGYNGYQESVAVGILDRVGWPRADAAEVARLSGLWVAHAGPATPRDEGAGETPRLDTVE